MKQFFVLLSLFISSLTFANVTASFTMSAAKGCSPLVVNLTDHSTGNITSRIWDLGNGNSSTELNPSATYLNTGTYIIKLVVSNGTSADSFFQTVTVYTGPTVNFTTDVASACPGDSINFINQATNGSAPINQYAWGFGNGIASSQTNVKYGYTQPGTYDITLVVQDTNGCDAHLTEAGLITIWSKPVAAFTVSPQVTCGLSQTVSFSNQSTGSGLTYSWQMGDSTYAAAANPQHLYAFGKYNTVLSVTNSDGCTSKVTEKISVINLKADFMASKTTVCAGETVYFSDQSPMPGTVWYWNFGDGSVSAKQNPSKVYTTPGVYTVTFGVNDAICGDTLVKIGYITVTTGFAVNFTADQRNSCTTPFTVNFAGQAPAGASLVWSFGNGGSASGSNPANTYTASSLYTVSLTATDTSGCIVTVTVPGFINTTMPIPRFTSDTLFCPGATAQFDNQSVFATKYLWHFGDGDTSTQISPAHAYTHYGRYTVSLTAWDSIGCDTTLIKTNLIFVDSTKIGFSVDEKFSRCPPLVSVFSSYADRNDLKYLWNFGDGYTDTAANPTHIYFHPGIYTVKLTGTSKYGCTNTVIDSGLIVVQGPSGAFNINPNSGCVPVTVSFSGATSSNVETVICDLGNGTLYTDSLNFNYTYNAAGIFHPKFILTDHIGCSVPYSLDSIITHSRPMLIVKDTSICTGSSISVNLGSDQYLWKTPVAGCDTCLKELSYCDTCSNVILTPSDSTLYVVTATNGAGCSVTDSIRVNVAAMPILIPHDTIRLCRNSSVDIQAIQNAYAATWTPELYLNSYSAFQTTCTPMANVDYTVTAFNRLGCSVSEAIPVRVVNNIGVAVSGDTAVCAGSAVQLHVACTDTFLYGVVYTWQPAAGISNMHSQSPTVTAPSETEKYTVIATSGSCAADTATITVSINAPATVKLPGTITTTPLAEVDIAPVSGDLATYSWSAKDDLSCTTCAATTILPKESQLVYLEGTNQYGCNTKDSMFIHVLNCDPAGIFVPNTFTPNGDGLNDRLYVRSKTLAQLEYFRLYDRWGAVVFETKNMSEGWDGVINGRIAEQGVYVYQVNGKCENGYDVATSGTVTLVR